MKKLYQNKVTMPNFCDLIGTSNTESRPCYIGEDNRRTEMIKINPEKVNNTPTNKKFWDDFYDSLDDVHLCGKIFYLLANWTIDMDVTSKECRFDKEELKVHKLRNMKITHRWACNFFSDQECFESSCSNPYRYPKWFDKLRFREAKISGIRTVFIQKNRAFDYFINWKRKGGHKTDIREPTFIDDLKSIGIMSCRRDMESGSKLTGYEFSVPRVTAGITKFYKTGCGAIKIDYKFTEEQEFKALCKNTWRFRK
jgi:hypothetical protein